MTPTAPKACKPQLVVFDLYGTLIKFGVMHHPFRELLKWARANDRVPRQDDARQLMTINGDLVELALRLGIKAPDALLTTLQKNIEEELESLTLFEDVIPALDSLQCMGVPIAICSNLAKPYGAALDKLLPQYKLIKLLSYEIGFIKPEPEIYQAIVSTSGVSASNSLFIGDTYIADYEGPVRNGFQARHLVRSQKAGAITIKSLREVPGLLD